MQGRTASSIIWEITSGAVVAFEGHSRSSETWGLHPPSMATSDMTAGQMRQLVHDTRYGDVMRAESSKQNRLCALISVRSGKKSRASKLRSRC